MLLGQYHPRLLAITTPNYTYNARFDKAARDQGLDPRAQGYPDPTGRTDRVFRHDDHKFEWTTEEFTEYCQTEAKKYGYAVDITGVGNCMEGGDTHLGYASLCALFKRERGAPVEAAIAKPAPAALSATPHSLLCEQQYTAHISSGKPAPYADIIAEVKDGFKRCNDDTLSLQDLWNQRSLTIACGGRPEEIYKAVAKHGSREDKWAILDEGKKWTVKVKWGAFVKSEDPWAEDPPDSDDDGIGEDWEDLDERRDLEQSYVGAGTWEMKMGATALHWNTADLEASMKSWGTKSSGSTSGGWGRIESAEAEDEDPEWTNGSFSQSPPKRSPLSQGQKKR
jgi:small RNA 2'-O-methyltransferase